MKMSRLILLIPLLLLVLTSSLSQQNAVPYKRCSVKTLNYDQGLLNNGTTNIITDVKGFTWVSTFTGMQRYNGYMLEQINPVIDNKIIEINSPVFFFNLHNGNIWISYKQGALEYSPYTNQFKKIITLNADGRIPFSIVPLGETSEGVWCMQQSKGIVIYNRRNNIVQAIAGFDHTLSDALINSPDFLYRAKIAVSRSLIFILSSATNILQINTTDHSYKKINFNTGAIQSIACNADKLFIVSANRLLRINTNTDSVELTIALNTFISEKFVDGTIIAEGNSRLLFNINRHLYESGTAFLNQKELTTLSRTPLVSAGYIQHIYSDKFKRIWLLTNDDIKRIENFELPFAHFIYPSAKNNFVRSVYYDEQKHLLIAGCFNGGIQLYDTLANPLWQKPVLSENVKDILGIDKLNNNDYLIITYGKGWYVLNLTTKQLQPFYISPSYRK